MKLLRLSILLVAPAVFCATTPKTEIDAITNAIIDQFLNQHDLELLLKAAEREASEAIIQHAEALQMQNTPRDFSELIEKLSSETSFKAAQLSLPLSGLLGGLTGIISNITIQITPSSPLASPSTSPLPAILSNPVGSLTGLLNNTLGGPLNNTNGILSNPLNITSNILPITNSIVGGVLPNISSVNGGILPDLVNAASSLLPVSLDTVSGILSNVSNLNGSVLPDLVNAASSILADPLGSVETILSSPLDLSDLLNNGIFNLSNPLGPSSPLAAVTDGLNNVTGILGNLTGVPLVDIGTLIDALGNLTQNVTGNLPLLNGTLSPLPLVLGGILSNIAQGAASGSLNPFTIPGIQPPVGPIAIALASGLLNIPQLLAAVAANANYDPLQTLLSLIALNSDGIFPSLFRFFILLSAAIRAILTLIFNVLGSLGQGNSSTLPPILLGVIGQLLSNGVLRIDAGSFNNVNQVQHVVREVLQRAVSSDPIVMSAMNSPSQESIANAISSIILSVSENMAAAA